MGGDSVDRAVHSGWGQMSEDLLPASAALGVFIRVRIVMGSYSWVAQCAFAWLRLAVGCVRPITARPVAVIEADRLSSLAESLPQSLE